jgi:hypothetical protein
MENISEDVGNLIARCRAYEDGQGMGGEREGEKIHVDEIASKLATLYDKFRNLIQYHEAHLLRRETIERVLRRRILLKTSGGKFAEAFIKDLIRSGHLPNDTVPETKVPEVQLTIDNLLYFLEQENGDGLNLGRGISSWLLQIFVPAIEDELFPLPENRLVADTMYDVMRKHLVLKNIKGNTEDIETQLFIAVQRSMFRFDDDQLRYQLLKFLYPNWGKMGELELANIAKELPDVKKRIDGILGDPLSSYFFKVCQKEKIAFELLGDLVMSDVPLTDGFGNELRTLYAEREERVSRQLKKLAFFSVISFLASKVAVALAVEIPLDRILGYPFSYPNLAFNMLFPPFLMLAIVTFVRPPSRKNFDLVAREVNSLIYEGREKEYFITVPPKQGRYVTVFVNLAYFVALAFVLYVIIHFLSILRFSPPSIAIFLLFTSMIIATGVKINNRAHEMSLEKKKATVLGFLADLVIIPFMAIGKWVIAGLSKLNILVVVFDFFIELPLGFFIEFLENFRKFINAKKEEIG